MGGNDGYSEYNDDDGDSLLNYEEIQGIEIYFETVHETVNYEYQWDESIGDYVEVSVMETYTEFYSEVVYTDYLNWDTDGDLLPDDFEVYSMGQFHPTDPSDGQSDGDFDGLTAGEEYTIGTDFDLADTDLDGYSDGLEFFVLLSDPLDPNSPGPEENENENPDGNDGNNDNDGAPGGINNEDNANNNGIPDSEESPEAETDEADLPPEPTDDGSVGEEDQTPEEPAPPPEPLEYEFVGISSSLSLVEGEAEYEYDEGGATVRLVETASNLQEVALLEADGYSIADEPYTTPEGDTIWTMEKFIEEGNGMVYDYVANNPRFGEKILEESIDSESPYEGPGEPEDELELPGIGNAGIHPDLMDTKAELSSGNYPTGTWKSLQFRLKGNKVAPHDISKTWLAISGPLDDSAVNQEKEIGVVTLTIPEGKNVAESGTLVGEVSAITIEGGVVLQQPSRGRKVSLFPTGFQTIEKRGYLLAGIPITLDEWNSAQELRVANLPSEIWNESPAGLKPGFIDEDPNRFRIRIPKLGPAKPEVKIRTEALFPAYFDPPSPVELIEDPKDSNFWITKSQILVSDEKDDIYQKNGAGVDESLTDRTHLVVLFGKAVAEIAFPGIANPLELEIQIPERKNRLEMKLRIVVVRDGEGNAPISEDDTWDYMMYAIERFAQANVVILPENVERVTVDQPEGVDFDDGLDIGPKAYVTELAKYPMTDELISLFDAYGTPGDISDYTLFIVNKFQPWALDGDQPFAKGIAMAQFAIRDSLQDYANNCVISVEGRGGLNTAGHELGHLITNGGHFGGGLNPLYGAWNLMFKYSSTNDPRSVIARKRLNGSQIKSIRSELD